MEKELFNIALGIEEPLFISEITFEPANGELHVHIDFPRGARFACAECGAVDLPVHDTKEKSWRHLNFFQYKCFLHLRTPRTKCDKCGERLWVPPWGRSQSGFTLLFEAFVLVLAKDMPVSKIAELVDEHDTRIWRIVRHHVKNAHAKMDFSSVTHISCDETSSRKGHQYVTVIADIDSKKVLYATPGRDAGTLKAFTDELPKHQANAEQITELSIDMSPAYILGAASCFENASVTYDKFHVVQLLNKAMDEVRRMEQKQNPLLTKSRYIWLKNPENLTAKQKTQLETLRHENMKTARVYQMKLTFQDIYRSINEPVAAEEAIKKWLSWAVRSRLDPIKRFAKMVKSHFDGILRYFTSRLTSGLAEGINSRIQEVKRRARGFRNIDNFISMIYLEASGLPLPTFCEISHLK